MGGLPVKTGLHAPAAPCTHPWAMLEHKVVPVVDTYVAFGVNERIKIGIGATFCRCGVAVPSDVAWRKIMMGDR